MLHYEESPPPPELRRFVRCFWTLRGEGEPASVDRILPDGSFELVFHRGEPFVLDGMPQPRAMLVGQIRRPTLVASSRQADVFGIRFRIGGFGALTGLHARELRDAIHDLRDVFRQDDPASILRTLIRSRREVPDRRLAAAVAAIVRRDGNVRIAHLSAAIGTSERTLERLFDRHVGLPPKELARVVRFQASLRGVESGYFDDSHRIHDFHEFAGATPSAIFEGRTAVTDAFVGNLQDDARDLDR